MTVIQGNRCVVETNSEDDQINMLIHDDDALAGLVKKEKDSHLFD